MRHRRRRSYNDDDGNPRRVDKSALRVIARHVRAHDRTTADEHIERDFFVLDPKRAPQRLAPK